MSAARRRIDTDDVPTSAARGRRVRGTVAGWIAAAGAGVAASLLLVVRSTSLQEVSFRWAGLAALAPVLAPMLLGIGLAGAVAVLIASRLEGPPVPRRRPAAAVVLGVALPAVLAVQGGWLALSPPGTGARSAVDGPELTLLVQNLWYENPDPDRAARMVVGRGADVVVLVEYTGRHARAMAAAGAPDLYPHHHLDPQPLGGGVAVWSRHPVSGVEPIGLWGGSVRVRLDVPGAEGVDLLAVHPTAPSDHWSLRRWKQDYATLAALAPGFGGTTVVAGDMNATQGHRRLRGLMEVGRLRDVAAEVDAGLAPTWPATAAFPPVMRLDQVLVGPAIGIEAIDVVRGAGSDHLGVEARLRVPRP